MTPKEQEMLQKYINHTVDWHRPMPRGTDIECACATDADQWMTSHEYVKHLQDSLKNDLQLYGVLD